MNKKRGFTLAELLGVIIIIGVLALLILPTIDNSIEENKNKLYETQLKNIEEAATNWAAHHMMELPENENESIIIHLRDLKEGGYVDNDISDPRNGELLSDDMIITIIRKNNKYVYEVGGSGKNPVIVLKPSSTTKFEKSVTIHVNVTPYEDSKISKLVYKLDGGEEQLVANNQIRLTTEGNHTLEVIATDNEGRVSTYTSGTYTIDTTAPTISFAEASHAAFRIEIGDYANRNMLTGVSVSDNNDISLDNVTVGDGLEQTIGSYTVTYTVTDEAGNSTSKTRNVAVEADCNTTITLMGKSIVSCDTATNDPDSNLRFVGSNPNNYVKFNNELWRIIGVFDGQMKLIRNEYYSTGIAFDKGSSDGGTHGYNGYNDWNQATLKDELNGTYLGSIQASDPTSYSYIDLTHIWNLGGTPNWKTSTRSDFYSAERSETISSSMTSSTWTGVIGLMYPSDYGYSTSATDTECDSTVIYSWGSYPLCYSNSWLYNSDYRQWTITPRSDHSSSVFYVFGDDFVIFGYNAVNGKGYVSENYAYSTVGAARPSLFLKSNVGIVSGTGKMDDPFILGT